MMRKWVSKIALCGLAAALQVAAAPSRPPPADAYNNSGYAGPPAHAEAYPDRRGWGDSSLPYRSADGNTAAAVAAGAENANPAAGYEDIPWQNEAAPAVAKGAGPRNGQEAVMDHSAFSVGNMAASRGPEFAAQANGFGGFQGGGGDMQGMLMHPGEPMARLLSLPKAPKPAGYKTSVIGLFALLSIFWLYLEVVHITEFNPIHAIGEGLGMDGDEFCSQAAWALVSIGLLFLLVGQARHQWRRRKQKKWMKNAEEAIEAIKANHPIQLQHTQARQRSPHPTAAGAGKY